jgi:hypothetical protein
MVNRQRDERDWSGTDMTTLREAADEFLAQRRIAVAGVSRDPKRPADLIYRRLRDTGHEVFAINPNAGEVEGDGATADPGHKWLRTMLRAAGELLRTIEYLGEGV